jgi:hypothetical protein
MALETLKDVTHIDGLEIKTYNKSVRGESIETHVVVDTKNNRLHFQIQNGPIKENGVNGCQVTDILKVCAHIFKGLNAKFPCKENAMTITKLQEAIMWQEERTKDREARCVEGTNNA